MALEHRKPKDIQEVCINVPLPPYVRMARSQQLWSQITVLLWELENESEWLWTMYELDEYFGVQRALGSTAKKSPISSNPPKNVKLLLRLIKEYKTFNTQLKEPESISNVPVNPVEVD
jgi:hypothetical protein